MGLFNVVPRHTRARMCNFSRDAKFTFCNTVYKLTSGYCSSTDDEHHPDRTPHRYKFRFDSEI